MNGASESFVFFETIQERPEGWLAFTDEGLAALAPAIVARLKALGLVGVYVQPDAAELRVQDGRVVDLRAKGVTTLTMIVTTGQVSKVRTIGIGERLPPDQTTDHPFHARKGSVGKPIGGVEVKIAPDGEIMVRGDNVTSGYFQHPEETARAFEGGWFHTGDIGELDAGGRLVIKGRKKEMIVTPQGLNVFPEDVEKALLAQRDVASAVIPGRRAAANSESITAD